MPKYPLTVTPFPPLALSRDDERKLEAAAEVVVKKTIELYNEHLTVHKGVVDENRWKKIKTRDDVRVYRERRSSIDDTASNSSEDSAAEGDKVVSLLTFGTIQGNLDDVMYGALNPDTEDMQLKTLYGGDGYADWCVLAKVLKPTEQSPFRELGIKWAVKDSLSMLGGAIMRARDVLYIESIGFAKTPSGERIGYHLRHSVDIPEVRELPEFQLVRASISFCHIFRQRKENCVELLIRGFFSPRGDAPYNLAATMGGEVSVADAKNVHCAEMKKLARMLLTAQAHRHCRGSDPSSLASSSGASGSGAANSVASITSASAQPSASGSASGSDVSTCAICSQSLSGGALSFSSSKEKQCRICLASVCSRCCVSKTLYLPTQVEKVRSSASLSFCTRCLLSASAASSTEFAILDALAAEGQSVDYLEIVAKKTLAP